MAGNPKVNEAGDLGAGELEHRFTNKNLTPQPPSLPLPNPPLQGEGKGKIFILGRGRKKSALASLQLLALNR